jgi:hypothetical protein
VLGLSFLVMITKAGIYNLIDMCAMIQSNIKLLELFISVTRLLVYSVPCEHNQHQKKISNKHSDNNFIYIHNYENINVQPGN